jgi:hypothetical protein
MPPSRFIVPSVRTEHMAEALPCHVGADTRQSVVAVV